MKHLENIKITFDDTDHFHFVCPDCGVIMQVVDVSEIKPERTTLFIARCEVCKGTGHRKINWNTFHKPEDL